MRDYFKRGGGLVHKSANIVGDVEVGEGTRIDAFVTITGPAKIGRYVHISNGCAIFGGSGFEMGDYSALSGNVYVYTSTEDVSGEWVTNPTVPAHLRNPINRPVYIGAHAECGAGAVLLPGAHLSEGSFLGALSLCKSRLEPWGIYVGVPAKFKKFRTRGVLAKVEEFECLPTT